MAKMQLIGVLGTVLGLAAPAAAEPGFAAPPDPFPGEEREPLPEQPPYAVADASRSTMRVAVGPALLLSDQSTEGGFAAMADIGARAAGARLAGAWLNVGGEHGLSQYTAELWIDFGSGRDLHPVLAAGAGLGRVEQTAEDGSKSRSSVGLGTLRGTLEYVLPIAEADARAGVDVTGAVPAIRSQASDAPSEPWIVAVARVGVGF